MVYQVIIVENKIWNQKRNMAFIMKVSLNFQWKWTIKDYDQKLTFADCYTMKKAKKFSRNK